ncbi:hypothetical protein [Ruminococcus sp.]|uniref:hypothetical protein n=1 Tax=Ruminococcus sp. TaxID=41978 RepID=UPI003451FCF6
MPNPWEEISLDDYEKHMSLDSVRQLQALDSIMEEIGYSLIFQESCLLPNGKALVRLDFQKKG